MQVFKAGKSVCFLLAQAQNGILWGVKEGKETTKILTPRLTFRQASQTFQGLLMNDQGFSLHIET